MKERKSHLFGSFQLEASDSSNDQTYYQEQDTRDCLHYAQLLVAVLKVLRRRPLP